MPDEMDGQKYPSSHQFYTTSSNAGSHQQPFLSLFCNLTSMGASHRGREKQPPKLPCQKLSRGTGLGLPCCGALPAFSQDLIFLLFPTEKKLSTTLKVDSPPPAWVTVIWRCVCFGKVPSCASQGTAASRELVLAHAKLSFHPFRFISA